MTHSFRKGDKVRIIPLNKEGVILFFEKNLNNYAHVLVGDKKIVKSVTDLEKLP